MASWFSYTQNSYITRKWCMKFPEKRRKLSNLTVINEVHTCDWFNTESGHLVFSVKNDTEKKDLIVIIEMSGGPKTHNHDTWGIKIVQLEPRGPKLHNRDTWETKIEQLEPEWHKSHNRGIWGLKMQLNQNNIKFAKMGSLTVKVAHPSQSLTSMFTCELHL